MRYFILVGLLLAVTGIFILAQTPPATNHFFVTGGFSIAQETDVTNALFAAKCADTDTTCTQTVELCPQNDNSMTGCVELVNGTTTLLVVQKTTKSGKTESTQISKVIVTARPWKFETR